MMLHYDVKQDCLVMLYMTCIYNIYIIYLLCSYIYNLLLQLHAVITSQAIYNIFTAHKGISITMMK